MRSYLAWALLPVLALPLGAAERTFDFSQVKEGETPPGFRSTVTGVGKPGKWEVVQDEVAPLLEPLTPNAPVVAKRAVLGQFSQDPADEHFPLLIYQDETYDDFKLTTRFKTVKGVKEQMAGIAFRIQNETNYYVVRASSLGNTFRFYKIVNGDRGMLIGPEVKIPSGTWHELSVECKGNQINCWLDGKDLIPTLTDNSFARGKIGFWTKSDSVSYFSDTKITYKRHDPPAQEILREVLKEYPRLVGLEIYVQGDDPAKPRLLASKDAAKNGTFGGKVEQDVLARSVNYYGKDRKSVTITVPIRDRNGDTVAAARIVMSTFPGQTEQNAFARGMPIAKAIESRISTLKELLD
jgi:hypothetical protein